MCTWLFIIYAHMECVSFFVVVVVVVDNNIMKNEYIMYGVSV